jgi:transcriptional regulator with XRE-family HTH domain
MNRRLHIKNIESRLEQLGLNQSQLADKVGVSREAVSKWLNAETFPRPRALLNIARTLNLSLETLTVKAEPETEPIVAFRKKAHYKTQDTHIKQAKDMGYLLELLTPYLPFNKFEAPPTLKPSSRSMLMSYDYIQNVTAEIRRELDIRAEEVITPQILIEKFRTLQAVVIPVLWGARDRHENALHIYLPFSMSTWVYLNLDSNIHDFKFWMAHELGHVYIRDLQGDDAEDFADLFAQSLLFPRECAHQAYNQLITLKNIGSRVNKVKQIAKENQISPFTVYCAVNSYAEVYSLRKVKISTIHPATTNFNKDYPTVVQSLVKGDEISVDAYLKIVKEHFKSPFFDMLKSYLLEHKKSAGFVQDVLCIPHIDAAAIYRELT